MRLTVLGSSASYAGAGQACSGYLLRAGGARVLLDAGNGAVANLARIADPASIDAVFITHAHPDHFLDLYSLLSRLRYGPEGPAAALPLFLPEGLFERMQLLLSERGAAELKAGFVPATLEDGVSVEVGELTVTPHLVPHTEPTFALVAEIDGARLAYSADTEYGAAALEAARDADLLVCEATMPEGYAGSAPHLTPGQAGSLAARAGARRLLLTHLWPGADPNVVTNAARAAFAGPLSIAREMDEYEILPRGTDQ